MAKKKKSKNSLALSLQKELPDKKTQLQLLKEEELKALRHLLAIRKRRLDLEKDIRESEEYVTRADKFS